jgi:nicotinate-nucleotide pyrophosphorylase (carboxylating)
MRPEPLPDLLIEPAVRAALAEDLGRAGDITSQATIAPDARATVEMRARKAGAIAGLRFAEIAFRTLDPEAGILKSAEDGARVTPGAILMTVTGRTRAILSAERTALNFAGRLSGIATLTAAFVDAAAGTGARICDTRKTTPGWRAFEKYAVRCGGGANHRFGLDDAILIKDNHVAAAGGVAEAIRRARAFAGHLTAIEVEVDSLAQLREALAAGVEAVLLDNMDTATLREAVAITGKRAKLEASGNVTLQTVRAIAETGVDMISSGALTHSAPNFDIGLDFVSGV